MSTATLTPPELSSLTGNQSPLAPVSPHPATDSPGDIPYEVIDGQIQEKASGFTEAEIATLIAERLGPFVRTHGLGRVTVEGLFRLQPDQKLYRRPDVAFVSHSRRLKNRPDASAAACDLAPDLAVEVNSPTNTAEELLRKVHEYFNAGVTRVWVVFPSEQEVYAYSAPNQVQILTLDQSIEDQTLLPGFTLRLKTLFEDQLLTPTPEEGNA